MKGYCLSTVIICGAGLHYAIPGVVANAWRGIADMSHLCAILILFYRVVLAGKKKGISSQSQELYFLVFLCRYVDVVFGFQWYLTTMKVSFVLLTLTTRLFLTRGEETLRSPYFVLFAGIVAAIQQAHVPTSTEYRVLDFLWAFSIALEPFAIIPQFLLLAWHSMEDYYFKEIEALVGRYVFFLGIYRCLYIVNWIHRSATESDFNPYYHRYNNVLVYSAAALQALLYCDFAHYYLRRKIYGRNTSTRLIFLLCRSGKGEGRRQKTGTDKLLAVAPAAAEDR